MIQYQFFPRSRGITQEMQSIIQCFVDVQEEIDSKTHENLESNDVLAQVCSAMESLDFKVERSKRAEDKIDVPVLFGPNNKIDKSFYADALSSDGRIVIEVESGRALVNNQFLKDIFEASMMFEVEYLVLAVRNKYRSSNDFDKIHTFIETMYISGRIQLPLKGILLIGY